MINPKNYGVHIKKRYIYFFLFFLIALEAYAQIDMQSFILNASPEVSEIKTYSRYDSSTDNFQENNFFICKGEENRTVYLRIVAKDSNSNSEISGGGNVSLKIVYVVNSSEIDASSFGSSFKEPIFESSIGITMLSYVYNITLSNTSLYRIITNVTDVNNYSGHGYYNFTINDTNCLRLEQDVDLVENQAYTLKASFTEILLVVEDNVSGKIIITEYNHSPVDNTPADALEKFVTVDITGPIKNVTVNLTLVINYTDAEVFVNGLDESTLNVHNWNGTGWELKNSTVSSFENTITFLVQGTKSGISDVRLGTFCIMGSGEETSTPDAGSESSGSISGGSIAGFGGRGSGFFPSPDEETGQDGENQDEQQSKETSQEQTTKEEEGSLPSLEKPQEIFCMEEEEEENALISWLMATLNNKYYDIIIIILFLLWIITLILLILERKKQNSCKFEKIEFEKQKFLKKRKELNKKISLLQEEEKQELHRIRKKVYGSNKKYVKQHAKDLTGKK